MGLSDIPNGNESFKRRNPHLFPQLHAEDSGPASEGDEAALHNDIIQFCKRKVWPYFHGSMARRTHRTVGEPDFIILPDHQPVVMVECKRKGGKLRPEQVAMIVWAETVGHKIYVVHSMQEFNEALNENQRSGRGQE